MQESSFEFLSYYSQKNFILSCSCDGAYQCCRSSLYGVDHRIRDWVSIPLSMQEDWKKHKWQATKTPVSSSSNVRSKNASNALISLLTRFVESNLSHFNDFVNLLQMYIQKIQRIFVWVVAFGSRARSIINVVLLALEMLNVIQKLPAAYMGPIFPREEAKENLIRERADARCEGQGFDGADEYGDTGLAFVGARGELVEETAGIHLSHGHHDWTNPAQRHRRIGAVVRQVAQRAPDALTAHWHAGR
jgi:hypothetical protein